MCLFFARSFDDLLRCQSNALVNDLHSGVARADRDLLGAVGMAVEPRFADEESETATQLARNAIDIGTNVIEAGDVVAHCTANPGGGAVFAEGFAQGPPPFARGNAGFGAGNRGRHDIATPGGGSFLLLQSLADS